MAQDFVPLKTPTVEAHDDVHGRPTTQSSRSLITTLRLVILLMMAMFVFGNIATWAPMYELQLINTFTKWWKGYPHGDSGGVHAGHSGSVMDTGVERNITHTGHTEMVRPTFLFLFCILPFFVGVMLIEALRIVSPARRVTSTVLWRTAMVLRRKPWLPVLGVSRFTLGEWVFGVIFVIGGNLLCFYYEWDRRIDSARAQEKKTGTIVLTTAKYYNIVGISCAYLAIYNMALLLLPVTRGSVWMEFFNVSYANGVKLHRWMGFATVITSVIHMVGYWGKWVINGTWRLYQLPCIHCDITDEFTGYYAWFNTFGFISVLAMLLMIPTSLPIVRRKMYEWFYVSHWVLFVISFFFAILHWAQIIWWILPAGLLFFISRAASTWNGTAPVTVSQCSIVSNSSDGSELVELVLKRSVSSRHSDFKIGNFVYLNVPALAKLQWHALTIASSPRSSSTDFTLLIKPVGEWSQQLVQYVKDCKANNESPLVYVDGFYGSTLDDYNEYGTICMVGGGIGVTPLLSMLDDIATKISQQRNGPWSQPHVVLVLAFRELALLRAIAPVLLRLKELDPSGTYFKTYLYGTRQPSDAALDESCAVSSEIAAPKETLDGRGKASTDRPFYEPLRSSSGLRFALFVVLFAVAIAVVTAVRWGNGAIQGDNHPELWPLERAFEFVVFCATIVVAHAFIWYEYATLRRVSGDIPSDNVDAPGATASRPADVATMRDLASHLNVVFGERPQLQLLLSTVRDDHKNHIATHPTIGVFVSGPVELKSATNEAVVNLGRQDFDVHEEEFEL